MPEFEAGSPRFWLHSLYEELRVRRVKVAKAERYYNGRHRLQFATPKFRETFGSLFQAFSDNWCPVVVDASVERMAVQGFRIGDSADADSAAWDLWKRNFLDADSGIAMLEAVKCGEAFVLVAPPERGSRTPRITVEHPSEVVVRRAAGDRRKRAAALKVFLDESGYLFATVYLPDALYRFQSKRPATEGAVEVDWVERRGVAHRVPHDFGVVPVVPLENVPGMLDGGRSDLEPVYPLQDAINKLTTDMIVASEYVAMPQRWATGIELPLDEDGNEVDEERFLSWLGRVWTSEDPESKFGQFPEASFANYTAAIGMLIQHLSAQTRTPPHYLVGQIVNASGDALAAAETGLVSKVRRKELHLGPAWAEVMRLAFVAAGDADRSDPDVLRETIWRNPESRSDAEVMDAGTKMLSLNVPDEGVWEFIGATPEQIARWRRLRDSQLVQAQLLAFAGARPGDQGVPDEPPEADDEDAASGADAAVAVGVGRAG